MKFRHFKTSRGGNPKGKAVYRIGSIKEGKPQWDMLGVPGIETLPVVQFEFQTIRRITPAKHPEALRKLRDYLGV